MEYRLNVLGGLNYIADQFKIEKWDPETFYTVLAWLGVSNYSREDIIYWLEQLNRKEN